METLFGEYVLEICDSFRDKGELSGFWVGPPPSARDHSGVTGIWNRVDIEPGALSLGHWHQYVWRIDEN